MPPAPPPRTLAPQPEAQEPGDLDDIRAGDWVDRVLPSPVRPYARLARIDRPVGVWLTLLPCLAALVQASGGLPGWRVSTIFTLGAILMRSAGSTINDIADRDFDGQVERTRHRPLAVGAIGTRSALLFLVAELLLAAALLPFLSSSTRLIALGVVPLVFLYPFCKRFTHWPQAVLGAAFNWGMIMAWAEVRGSVTLGAMVMWLGTVFWQIGYDTIYGYVDAKDDAALGLRSTALLFGRKGRRLVGLFYALAVLAWAAGGRLIGMSGWYHVCLTFIALHLVWQLRRFDVDRPAVNFRMFVSNVGTGAALLAATLVGAP